jgi:hypothetical protein
MVTGEAKAAVLVLRARPGIGIAQGVHRRSRI